MSDNDCLFENVPIKTRIGYIQSMININNLDAKEKRIDIKHRKISIIHSFGVIALVIVEVPALVIIAYKMLGY